MEGAGPELKSYSICCDDSVAVGGERRSAALGKVGNVSACGAGAGGGARMREGRAVVMDVRVVESRGSLYENPQRVMVLAKLRRGKAVLSKVERASGCQKRTASMPSRLLEGSVQSPGPPPRAYRPNA